MGFSNEWEDRYSSDRQLSIWPWSDLVSYVMRYSRPNSLQFRVLELGCGAGANIPFFSQLGVQYFAIEGSKTIVNKLKKKFPEFDNRIIAGDFTKEIPFTGEFDLIVDRSSLTHNSTLDIISSLNLVLNKLIPGGKYIGIDWFSTMHTDFSKGKVVDQFTRAGFEDGQFKGIGQVHFSDKEHLKDLFLEFQIEIMEHKIAKREIPEDGYVFAAWNLVAKKRAG